MKSRNPVKVAKDALAGGVDILQLRDKTSTDREIIGYGRLLKSVLDSKGVPFIINDRLDISKVLDADGVHLGQDDVPLSRARSFLGKSKIIGVSTHSILEAVRAGGEGADYIAVGPIYNSPTKPKVKPRGLKLLEAVTKRSEVPVVAIGGIERDNIEDVLECGPDMIAVVSSILGKKNTKKAAYKLKRRV